MPPSRDALLRGSQLPPDWVQTGCCSSWHVDADQVPPTAVHTLWLEMAAQQTKGWSLVSKHVAGQDMAVG